MPAQRADEHRLRPGDCTSAYRGRAPVGSWALLALVLIGPRRPGPGPDLATPGELLDAVVAMLDDTLITQGDLLFEARVEALRQGERRLPPGSVVDGAALARTLERSLGERLLSREAERLGVMPLGLQERETLVGRVEAQAGGRRGARAVPHQAWRRPGAAGGAPGATGPGEPRPGEQAAGPGPGDGGRGATALCLPGRGARPSLRGGARGAPGAAAAGAGARGGGARAGATLSRGPDPAVCASSDPGARRNPDPGGTGEEARARGGGAGLAAAPDDRGRPGGGGGPGEALLLPPLVA